MKRSAIILMTLYFAAAAASFSFCEEISVKEWAPGSGIAGIFAQGDVLSFRSTSSMPALISKGNIFLNAEEFKVLEIRIRSNINYSAGRMFFRRVGDPGFFINNSAVFQAGPAGAFRSCLVDLGINPNWKGTIIQLALVPVESEGSVEIKSIKFLKPNFWLKTRMMWQELMEFEVPQLRTVNFMYGPKLNGVWINIYVYCLIAILSILIVSLEFLSSKGLMPALARSSAKIIIICLSIWVIMDMRMLFDQARSAVLDARTYYGKSLENKRALATLGDFYGFLLFCDARIPKRSGFDIVAPSYYYFREKAMYYLYPTRIEQDAEYVLVYDPGNAMSDEIGRYKKIGYRVFAKYKNEEFILKK